MHRISGRVILVGSFSRFFFIAYRDANGRIQEVFASRKDVIPDVIGRLNLKLGCPVSFALEAGPRGKRQVAVRIQDESADLLLIDPTIWREFGTVHKLIKNVQGIKYGKICRGEPGSDLLSFHANDIVSEGAEEIKVGDVLEYGLGKLITSSGEEIFCATDVHTCFAEGGEISLLEEFTSPDLEIVYTPAQKKMSLRQLIYQKQN